MATHSPAPHNRNLQVPGAQVTRAGPRNVWLAKVLRFPCALAFALLACAAASGQSIDQFWPEFNAYAPITSDTRLRFEVKNTREGTESEQTEFGPSFQFYAKPLVHLRDLSTMPRDEAKARVLLLSVGYRYVVSVSNGTSENRILLDATPQSPLKWQIVVADRNQLELRFINGVFSWRYRNRLAVQRKFQVRSYKFTPYARCEVFYSSQFAKWYDTAISAGSRFPLTSHFEMEAYLEHQNQTNKAPNQQINSLGLVLNVFF